MFTWDFRASPWVKFIGWPNVHFFLPSPSLFRVFISLVPGNGLRERTEELLQFFVIKPPQFSLLQLFEYMIGFQAGTRMKTDALPISSEAVEDLYGREVREQRITRW